jgi:hypothetical protein
MDDGWERWKGFASNGLILLISAYNYNAYDLPLETTLHIINLQPLSRPSIGRQLFRLFAHYISGFSLHPKQLSLR